MSMLKRVFCVLLTVVMLLAGAAHFTMTATYVAIMPSFLPFPLALVYLSGVLEIVLGLGLQIPALRRLAAWGLVALLIAVLPANINQAVHNLQPEGLQMSQTMLWVRIPMQLVFIAWAFWLTRPERQGG
ncbi:MAG: DoxX family protein [Nannocystis sp.]|uniref:DoxX family protein n=1 Tax=Nannocystis sp. TaxID=1962667 RepID=UPI00242464E0|nr:DoxX family protein [Nannocystis sp.]MBK9752029.1 DoxX family protein [Nannocystis sp.]